jgi:hypothetical protein
MKGITVKIGEREIPLYFGMDQFIEIEEEIGNLGTARDLILKDRKRLRNIVGMMRILGNGGLKKAGQEPDLTDEWLRENMDPHALLAYQVAVIDCLTRDGESEAITEENEEKERDEVLEEIQAKKAPVNSHTGG